MTPINLDELKRVSGRSCGANATHPLSSETLVKRQVELDNLIKYYFEKSGLPVEAINKLRAEIANERRRLSAVQAANKAENLPADKIGLRQAAANRQQALGILSVPFQYKIINLDLPFLIWEYPSPQFINPNPHLNFLLEGQIQRYDSFARILVDTHSGIAARDFVFHFIWTNPSEFAAVVNIDTFLHLNGFAHVTTDTTFYTGKTNYLNITAALEVYRWSGWGDDPITGESTNQTRLPLYGPPMYLTVATLTPTSGASAFNDPKQADQPFDFQQVRLGYKLLAIPAFATTVFEIRLQVTTISMMVATMIV